MKLVGQRNTHETLHEVFTIHSFRISKCLVRVKVVYFMLLPLGFSSVSRGILVGFSLQKKKKRGREKKTRLFWATPTLGLNTDISLPFITLMFDRLLP